MFDLLHLSPSLVIAFSAYFLGVASPGPSNLAIMNVAMRDGCKAALILASGVVMGSLTWGLLAAFGLSALLSAWSGALIVVKIFGGLYLLWLAFKSARSALKKRTPATALPALPVERARKLFLRGLALHLTNPKAIFVWLSIISMALPANASSAQTLPVVLGCVSIGIAVFGGYALLFSTAQARRVYRAMGRWLDGVLALTFGYAGLRILFSKTPTP